MAAVTGEALHKAINQGIVQARFMGVMLGDGWLGPVDCMASYGEYLLDLSLVTPEQKAQIDSYAVTAAKALAAGDGVGATNAWGDQQSYVSTVCGTRVCTQWGWMCCSPSAFRQLQLVRCRQHHRHGRARGRDELHSGAWRLRI